MCSLLLAESNMAIITVNNPPIETGVINALSEWNGFRVKVPLPKWVKPYNNNKISKESESDKPLNCPLDNVQGYQVFILTCANRTMNKSRGSL